MLPDQDVISTLYGHKIKIEDGYVYNLNERKIRGWNRRHGKRGKSGRNGWKNTRKFCIISAETSPGTKHTAAFSSPIMTAIG